MINLRSRSYTKEYLDNENVPFADIRQNMKELNTINTFLGGHKITLEGIKQLMKDDTKPRSLTICEIGCGGGDNLKAIDKYFKRLNKPVHFIGIDIKQECIAFAKEQYPKLKAEWILSDYKKINFEDRKPDIIFSSLFCHHFTEAEIKEMLLWMKRNSVIGFFINDLHRHPLAWYSIKWITKIFSRSYLVKNDAPLSVARSFTKKEWASALNTAGLEHYTIKWKWAFRYLVIYKNE